MFYPALQNQRAEAVCSCCLLSSIFYLFHTLPQAKYIFHFLKNLSTKLDPKVRLVFTWGLTLVKETSEARLNKFKRHLMMPTEPRPIFL